MFNGSSFIAACGAARLYETDTLCYGIDTWSGDVHAGDYSDSGDKIYEQVSNYVAQLNPQARLIRATFDEARSQFPDGSIDLLHIDGLHTYEAVAHDFSTWLPKISDAGIVLFHDIAVRERGFGVWQLWDEVRHNYPSFEFDHSFGLGVLFVGKHLQPAAEQFRYLVVNNADYREFLRSACTLLGASIPERVATRDRLGSPDAGSVFSPDGIVAGIARDVVRRSRAWRLLWPVLKRFQAFRSLEKAAR